MAYDIVKTIRQLVQRGLFHNDLKLANVMLTAAPDKAAFIRPGGCRVRLIDLGSMTNAREIPTVLSDESSAPELFLLKSPASELTETYSFGVLLFELFCEAVPKDQETARQVRFPDGLSTLHEHAVRAMSLDPTKRPPLAAFEGVLRVALEGASISSDTGVP